MDDKLWCELKCIRKDISDLRVDIATLKVKSGIWGIIGGSLPVIFAYIVYITKRL